MIPCTYVEVAMFGLLTRSPRRREAVAPRTVTLGLERLEDRLSPAGPFVSPGGTMSMTMPPLPLEQISLNVTYLPNRQVTLAGDVTNTPMPGGQTIQFGGVVGGTTTTDAGGNFSATLKAQALGQATATSLSMPSNTASVTLVSQQPVISNFQAVCQGNGVWLFSGTVSGPPTQGEVVTFGGITALNGQSVSVNADGTFSFYGVVAGGQGGVAWAEAVDWWGETSQAAMANVPC
jgi:hypothetical protein